MTETVCATDFDPAVLMARQSLYRFAGLTLLDPQAGSWEQLDALRQHALVLEAATLIRDLPAARSQSLGLGENPLDSLHPARVLARLPATRRELNEEFERTFGLLVSNACPPYETEYISSKYHFQRSNSLADVSGYYSAFGLTGSAIHAERPDHIVKELEFMAFLIGLERRAAADEASVRRQRVGVCRDAQASFLREHLAWWAPAFARLLSREAPGGFYDAAGEFLAALIPAERALLGIEPVEKNAEPSPLERPETCEGCELAN